MPDLLSPDLWLTVFKWVGGVSSALLLEASRRGLRQAWQQRHVALEYVRKIEHAIDTVPETARRVRAIEENLGENGGKSLGAQVISIHRDVRGVRASMMALTNLFSEDKILLYCEAGECTHANRGFQEMTGYGRSELLGHGWISAIDDSDRDRVLQAFHRAIADGRLLDIRVKWRHREGHIYDTTFSMRSHKDDENGEILGWLAEINIIVAHQAPGRERAS